VSRAHTFMTFGARAFALWIVTVALAACGTQTPDAPIIGGKPSTSRTLGAVAYIIQAVGKRGLLECTGTVVAADWVLTAGHCGIEPITGRRYAPRAFTVMVQVPTSRSLSLTAVGVTNILVYPGYGVNLRRPDAALLSLARPVRVTPIALPQGPVSNRGDMRATIAGWATDAVERRIPNMLSVAATVVQSKRWCAAHVSRFAADFELCAMGASTAICHGESGGPLVTFTRAGLAVQRGIASRSEHCAVDRPSTFVSVASIEPWIRANTGLADSKTA
jgi:secreted trypsin-like serine protease